MVLYSSTSCVQSVLAACTMGTSRVVVTLIRPTPVVAVATVDIRGTRRACGWAQPAAAAARCMPSLAAWSWPMCCWWWCVLGRGLSKLYLTIGGTCIACITGTAPFIRRWGPSSSVDSSVERKQDDAPAPAPAGCAGTAPWGASSAGTAGRSGAAAAAAAAAAAVAAAAGETTPGSVAAACGCWYCCCGGARRAAGREDCDCPEEGWGCPGKVSSRRRSSAQTCEKVGLSPGSLAQQCVASCTSSRGADAGKRGRSFCTATL
mmetsp:Transcript_36334/g.80857  ORF Transcript_36334/g.80857 Transcript_36334/m.80857 type:complete len:262 (-) Transcript_36334:2290-3075(-)